ncbi:MAG: TlpA disulfide reductase family protein [Cycloclasticus sp.]
MKKNHLLIVGFLAVSILLATSFIGIGETLQPKYEDSPVSGYSLRPEFSLPDLQGKVRNIKEWGGKFIVLNFWATWCTPCRKEIPEFIALQNEYGNSNLQFIGVAVDNAVSVDTFAMEMGINYPNLIAEMQGIDLAVQYGNTIGALPYSVIINPQKEIIFRHVGLLSPMKILDITQLSKD